MRSWPDESINTLFPPGPRLHASRVGLCQGPWNGRAFKVFSAPWLRQNAAGPRMKEGMDPSAQKEIAFHGARIRANAFLHQIYLDMYQRIGREIPVGTFPRVLEIGSGGGFFKEVLPHVVTSECVPVPGLDRVLDACRLADSVEAAAWDAITAFDVFHHLPDVEGFLDGVTHALRPGGRLVMVEPWFTPWGQALWRWIHPEPCRLDPDDWRLVGHGRMLGANSRLPTSVFRDSPRRFAQRFPNLRVVGTRPFHKWLYVASGGLRLNTRVPRPVGRLLLKLDALTTPLDPRLGVFACIVVERA